MNIKLLLINSHEEFNDFLIEDFKKKGDIDIVKATVDTVEELAAIRDLNIDVVFISTDDPYFLGIDIAKVIRNADERVKITVYLTIYDLMLYQDYRAINISGMVLNRFDYIIEMIHQVYNGGYYFEDSVKSKHSFCVVSCLLLTLGSLMILR